MTVDKFSRARGPDRLVQMLVACAAIPIGFRMAGTELALIDFVTPIGLLWIAMRWSDLRRRVPVLHRYALHAVAVCVIGIIGWASIGLLVARIPVVSTFATMGFFLRSLVFTVVALAICAFDPRGARMMFLTAISTASAIIAVPALLSGVSLRREFRSTVSDGFVVQLQGSFAGLDLYGQGQVNSFSLYLALAVGASIVLAADRMVSPIARGAAAVSAISAAAVVVQIGSRTGVLLLVALAGLFAIRASTNQLQATAVLAAFSAVMVAMWLPSSFGLPSVFDARLQDQLQIAQVVDLGEFSNGRFELARTILWDVMRSPVFGTGFADFDLFHLGNPDFGSPHNQWLGSAHKLGIPGGLAYCFFYIRIALDSPRSLARQVVWAAFFTLLVIDGLTVPVTGAVIAMILAVTRFSEPIAANGQQKSHERVLQRL